MAPKAKKTRLKKPKIGRIPSLFLTTGIPDSVGENSLRVNAHMEERWTTLSLLAYSFGKAFIKPNSDARDAFNAAVRKRNTLEEGTTPIKNFLGFTGFFNLVYMAGFDQTSMWTKLSVLRHYLNPMLYLDTASVFVDEFFSWAYTWGLKDDEQPGSVRITVGGVLKLISGTQRFVIGSVARCLDYGRPIIDKNTDEVVDRSGQKIFIFFTVISLIALNLVTYLNKGDEHGRNPDGTLTAHESYKMAAEWMFNHVILRFLGGEQDGNLPLGMSQDDKHIILESLIAFFVQWNAATIGASAVQCRNALNATLAGLELMQSDLDADESCCAIGFAAGLHTVLDGLMSAPSAAWDGVASCSSNLYNSATSSATTAWNFVTGCVRPSQPRIGGDVLAAALEAGGGVELGNLQQQQPPDNGQGMGAGIN